MANILAEVDPEPQISRARPQTCQYRGRLSEDAHRSPRSREFDCPTHRFPRCRSPRNLERITRSTEVSGRGNSLETLAIQDRNQVTNRRWDARRLRGPSRRRKLKPVSRRRRRRTPRNTRHLHLDKLGQTQQFPLRQPGGRIPAEPELAGRHRDR
jgi:hypothetical protein